MGIPGLGGRIGMIGSCVSARVRAFSLPMSRRTRTTRHTFEEHWQLLHAVDIIIIISRYFGVCKKKAAPPPPPWCGALATLEKEKGQRFVTGLVTYFSKLSVPSAMLISVV